METLKENIKHGKRVLNQLFSLSDTEIKKKLKSICNGVDTEELFTENTEVVRTIKNEIPTEIHLVSWDTLTVNWMGIYYKKEYELETTLIRFNKHFKL